MGKKKNQALSLLLNNTAVMNAPVRLHLTGANIRKCYGTFSHELHLRISV